MSHFTKVKTVIRDREVLCESLRELHYNFRQGDDLIIRGYQGNTQRAQVVIDTGCDYDIGFQHQPDQTYAVCADWWGVETTKGITEQEFVQKLNQRYAYHKVIKTVKKYNYQVEEEVKENKIYVRLTQW